MKILSIDTSSKICSVAILEDNNLIFEKTNNDEKTHSQKLMPLVDELFKETKLSLNDINLIVCCIGPGSFTGIRIGVSTVKAFSDAKDIPLIGVTSLEGLAYNIHTNGLICSLLDAKNDNVYFALYEHLNNTYTLKEEYLADNIHSIIDILKKYSNINITFVGDGSITHHNLISTNLQKCNFASNQENVQTSISLAIAGLTKYKCGNYGDSSSISPIYLKKSQAERALDGEK